MLQLVSIARAGAPISATSSLWSAVVQLSVESEGADVFTIDPTTEAGSKKRSAFANDLLRALGVSAGHAIRECVPIDQHGAILAELGTRVLSINLYARRDWVAGISDWGDEVDVLFESVAFSKLMSVLEGLSAPFNVDIAEVLSRPSLRD